MRHLIAVLVISAGSVSAFQTSTQPGLVWEAHDYQHGGGVEKAERATLTVPERHANPSGKTIQLAVVRLKARTPNPGPPIVYLAGGPGSSGIEAGRRRRYELFSALRDHGDVILFDQRGAGHSRPNLNCHETWGFDLAGTRTWQTMAALAWTRLEPCLTRLRAEGIDLTAYNTVENAADVDALRRALGAEKVRLLGISYGTHLGLTVMKRHPDAVARAVLAGVVGPAHVMKLPSNIDRVLDRFSDDLQAHPETRRETPLASSVRQILSTLERAPAQVVLQRDGQSVPVTVSAFDVRIILSLAMEDRDTMPSVPPLVTAMARGDFSPIAAQLAGIVRAPIPTAMNLAVECASGASADRMTRIRTEEAADVLGRVIDIPQPDICGAMGIPDLGEAFRSPVRSAVPTLLISGDLDLRTPPENAEEVRAGGLSNAAHLVLGRAGHDDDLLVASKELQHAIVAFLGGAPAVDRRIDLPPLLVKAR